MAAAFTLTATTAEQQLIELINQIQILESNVASNPDKKDCVSGTYNSNTGVFSAQITMPCTPIVGANGSTGYQATTYLGDSDPQP